MRCIPSCYFKLQGFYEKCVGMHLVCYYPYYSYLSTIPTSSIYLVAFYTYLCSFFNNIAAECGVHGQSLVSSFWHEAMHKHGQVSFRVVYPINSRAFMLHNLLHKRELSVTMRTRGSADKLFIALYVDLGCLDG